MWHDGGVVCVIFHVTFQKQVSLTGDFGSFCLFQRAASPLVGKSPRRHLMAALTFGKTWLLFLLKPLQLSGVLIIEKIWKMEDLILVQAFYICSHIFT